jgi:hypothetical protein
MPEAKTIEAPESKKEVSNGERNRLFLSKLTDEDSDLLLTAVAKHYGIDDGLVGAYKRKMYEELIDDEAEDIMEYLQEPLRSNFYPRWKRINQID